MESKDLRKEKIFNFEHYESCDVIPPLLKRGFKIDNHTLKFEPR